LREHLLAGTRDRSKRVFVNRAAGDIEVRNLLVEETDEGTHQAALGLPLFTEEEHVVPGNDGEVNLWDYGIFVADDAGKKFFVFFQHRQKIIEDFLFDRL
jgi:hypothetical protein